jgi:8-oxo-dGTP pyrophosphatase MutT (NUDIX family)
LQTHPDHFYRQSAAIPFRETAGALEVLLVTNRKGKRWIVPKGIVDHRWTAAQSAAKEAWEEAGVSGPVSRARLGTYRYRKWGGTCAVEVFALRVDRVAPTWPEDGSRIREWMPLEAAAHRVAEAELKDCLRRLPLWLSAADDRAWIRTNPQDPGKEEL